MCLMTGGSGGVGMILVDDDAGDESESSLNGRTMTVASQGKEKKK